MPCSFRNKSRSLKYVNMCGVLLGTIFASSTFAAPGNFLGNTVSGQTNSAVYTSPPGSYCSLNTDGSCESGDRDRQRATINTATGAGQISYDLYSLYVLVESNSESSSGSGLGLQRGQVDTSAEFEIYGWTDVDISNSFSSTVNDCFSSLTFRWEIRNATGLLYGDFEAVNGDFTNPPVSHTLRLPAGTYTISFTSDARAGYGTGCMSTPSTGQATYTLLTDIDLTEADIDCPADFNHDSVVDYFDYLDFVNAFGHDDMTWSGVWHLSATADFNGDGVVDYFDYLDFVDAMGVPCE